MRNLTIYLAGAMACCKSFEEMNGWREDLSQLLIEASESCNNYLGSDVRLRVINPCDYYTIVNPSHQNELEVMKFDLARVKESDIVIVNLDKLSQSIGTSIELYEAWRRDIPVIAFFEGTGGWDGIHPWVECCITRLEYGTESLIDYLTNFYF